jgi:thiamine biosynthesis lipoprotein
MRDELGTSFDCFGSSCGAFVTGSGRAGSPRAALALVRRELLSGHRRFSRFLPDSELSLLNGDPRWEVPVSAPMARFAQAVREAGAVTAGLVDATLVDQIERAGYTEDLRHPLPLARALQLAPARKPAAAAMAGGWQQVEVDLAGSTIARPPGVKLDSGGLAKGMFADMLAERLAGHASFAIDCAGDLAIGGAAEGVRPVAVESPFDGRRLHTFHLRRAGVATSGVGRRSWLDARGRPAHHLRDPASGEAAFTGVVQVTALAPSALRAEMYAKAAILSGPRAARSWLVHGGAIVFDDGSHEVIEPSSATIDPPPTVTLSELSAFAQPVAMRSAEAG